MAEGNMVRFDGTWGDHVCDICGLDLALEEEYFWCTECPATFYWCYKCFCTTRIQPNAPEDIEHLNADPNAYGGRVVTTTRDSHIHQFNPYKLDIRRRQSSTTETGESSKSDDKRPEDADEKRPEIDQKGAPVIEKAEYHE
jgi:hypothetical protein